MKLTSMQFDGDGGYDTPMNAGATAAASSAYQDGDDRIARASAAQARQNSAASKTYAPSALASQESGAIGSTSIASQMASDLGSPAKTVYSPGSDLGSSAKKTKAPKAIDKSGYDRSVKVSQATVDAVKNDGRGNMGQAAANKVAYGSPGYNGSTFSPNAPVSKEYKEAAKRVYPNAKATSPAATSGATNPKQSGPDAARAAATAPKAAAPKMYGGAAAEKYKSEKNKAALPPILPVTPKATPKASAPAKVKVSQATVDSVKSQGKTQAIANAKTNVTNAEYKEAVRRVYQSPAKAKPKAKSGGGGGKASSAVK
jgi:hypothetical protein